MEILVDKNFMTSVKYDSINSLDLRSDIENNNIFGCKLKPQGYVGNRPADAVEEHEDDTWAIDCIIDDNEVTTYLYTSEYEYNQDVELLKL